MILIILIMAFLFGFYGKTILHPNSFMFSSSGDGIKNYYTYAYYIEHNKSFTNFEGMNYPYGENFTYTDCHPVLAFFIRVIHMIFPGISNYSIGILNLFMLISLGLTAIILYFLFRELKVAHFLSVAGALGISILCPQIFRMTGHYGLSYGFFIPLTIILILRFEKGFHQKRILFFIALSILFFFTLHAYLGMISAMTVIVYGLISMANQLLAKKRLNIKKQILLLLSAIIPVATYYLFVKITDTHTGRTTNPWGILENHAEMGSVFLPVNSPLDTIRHFLFPNALQPWEGWSYIGLTTIIALIAFIIASVIFSFKSRKIRFDENWIDSLPLRQLFVTSLIVLAFSMFAPFRWYHLERLINYFDIIKQFRAIGRFAWVFYFISTIMLICMVNKAFEKLSAHKKKIGAFILAILIPSILIAEGWNYHKITAAEIVKSPNIFDLQHAPDNLKQDIRSVNIHHYQAILPFPFFYIGSENYGKTADDKIYHLSFLFSYHLGLPIIGSYLTRTSIYESKNIMQLLASNFYNKEIRKDLPNNKPFLLLCLNDRLNNVEKAYQEKAILLVKRDLYSLYEIDPDVFFENTAGQELTKFNELKDRLFKKDGFLVNDTSLYFKFIDFKSDKTDISISERNGCYFGAQKDFHILFTIEKGYLPLNKKYTARFWMYNDGENFGQDCLGGMNFFQKNTGDKLEWLDPIISAGNSQEINGNWSLVEIPFENIDNNASYELVFKGSDLAEKTIYIDDLLFYDNDLIIYKLINERNKLILFKNNHRITLPANN